MLQDPMTLYRAMHSIQISMLQAAREGRWDEVEDAKHTGTMLYQELRGLSRKKLDGVARDLARHLLSKVQMYQEEVLRLQEAATRYPEQAAEEREDGEAESGDETPTLH